MIGKFFDSSVHSFGGKHTAYAEYHRTPFPCFKVQNYAGDYNYNGRAKMEHGVAFMAEQPFDALPGKAERPPSSAQKARTWRSSLVTVISPGGRIRM